MIEKYWKLLICIPSSGAPGVMGGDTGSRLVQEPLNTGPGGTEPFITHKIVRQRAIEGILRKVGSDLSFSRSYTEVFAHFILFASRWS